MWPEVSLHAHMQFKNKKGILFFKKLCFFCLYLKKVYKKILKLTLEHGFKT